MARERVNLTGEILELDWDDDGNPTAWGIEDDNLDSYEFVESPKAKELAAHIGARAKVTGWASDDEDQYMSLLEVETFQILRDQEPEHASDDYDEYEPDDYDADDSL